MTSGSELVLSAAKNLNTIRKFVFSDELSTAIRLISGDDSIDAALLALSTNSSYPRDRLASAINHLEYAHISYSKILNSIKDRYDYDAKFYDVNVSIEKDLLVCSLITLCYCGLEDYLAARKSLEWGLQTLRKEEKFLEYRAARPSFLGIPAIEFHPKSYLSLPGMAVSLVKGFPKMFSNENFGMYSWQYEKFCESMQELL